MKVRFPVMIKDMTHSEFYDGPLAENWHVEDEEFFLDGPVTKRVATRDRIRTITATARIAFVMKEGALLVSKRP